MDKENKKLQKKLYLLVNTQIMEEQNKKIAIITGASKFGFLGLNDSLYRELTPLI
jgi:hypothetical protein